MFLCVRKKPLQSDLCFLCVRKNRCRVGGVEEGTAMLAIQTSLRHRTASFGAKREGHTTEAQLRRHSGSIDLGSSKIGPCTAHTRQC